MPEDEGGRRDLTVYQISVCNAERQAAKRRAKGAGVRRTE